MHHSRLKDQAPPDSSDEDEAAKGPKTVPFMNLPFTCCIRQYGLKVAEEDADKADAGNGRRWERIFGLFGTRISGI